MLTFKYGVMGSAKTAQALITAYNYKEKGLGVWLIKPSTDPRDAAGIIKSRVGLTSLCDVVKPEDSIALMFAKKRNVHVIICDEAQFLTAGQVRQLRRLALERDVICYGLRTDFQCNLFEGSKALMEIADNVEEIPSLCSCGKKAIFNARVDEEGKILTEGKQVAAGTYVPLCCACYLKKLSEGERENA